MRVAPGRRTAVASSSTQPHHLGDRIAADERGADVGAHRRRRARSSRSGTSIARRELVRRGGPRCASGPRSRRARPRPPSVGIPVVDREVEHPHVVAPVAQRGGRGPRRRSASGRARRWRRAGRAASGDDDIERRGAGSQRGLDRGRRVARGRTGTRGSGRPRGAGPPRAPGGTVISSPTTPGTASASSRPSTRCSDAGRGGSAASSRPRRRRIASRSPRSMPSAWRSTTSSSAMPAPNRSVRAQRPPIVRAATSMSTTRGGVDRVVDADLGVHRTLGQPDRVAPRATSCSTSASDRGAAAATA